MRKWYDAFLVGSASLETSAAGYEIIPDGCVVHDFTLYADDECHVMINHGDYVYLRAMQAVNITNGPVDSCRIRESGITYNWAGTSRGEREVAEEPCR